VKNGDGVEQRDPDVGGRLPAEHGHGTEYVAPQATRSRWEAMDPLNVFNPGVGGLSVAPRYGRGGGDDVDCEEEGRVMANK